MLKELIDSTSLEDFVAGLALATGQRIGIYDLNGSAVAESPPLSDFGRLVASPGEPLASIPASLPGTNGGASLTRIDGSGMQRLLSPLTIADETVGFVVVGEYADATIPFRRLRRIARLHGADIETLVQAWGKLPLLDPNQKAFPVSVQWITHTLSSWCRRESRNRSMREELSLVGIIAELMTGNDDLQTVLDRIVAETARAMKCRFSSIRLLTPGTGELVVKAVHNLSAAYLNKGPVLRGENPIDDAALRGEVVYVEDARRDSRVRFRDASRREGIVSGLSTGLIYRGRPVGVIRVYTDRPTRFRQVQRDLLRAVASQAAAAIVHSELIRQRLRDAEMNRQLTLAGEVQSRMMRTTLPEHPGLETAMVYEPSYEVGGDFCDYLTLPDGRTAFVVADVFGKGIPASLVMASVRSALRAKAQFCSDVGDLLTRLNKRVNADAFRGEYVTMSVVAIDADAARISVCNAGHDPPLVLRDGQVRSLDHGGLILGVDSQEIYSELAFPLRPGDFILLYTDGAIEAANFAGKLFGRRRLRESLIQHGALAPKQLLQNILWDIRRFVGLSEQADDLTMVGIRVMGGP